MIKLLRRIRYNLLETNNIKTYIKYAIGEIILVVIGILIALSINNCNTDRLNRTLEQQTLVSLRTDLLLQNTIIKNQINKENFFMSYVDSCMHMVKSEIDARKLSVFLDTLSVRLTFVTNRVTFDNMANTGRTNIITNKDLLKAIVDYYQFLDYTESVVNNNNLYRVNSQFGDYVLKNKLGIQLNDAGKPYLKHSLNPQQTYELAKQLEARKYSAANSRDKCALLLGRTNDLITSIDSELKHLD